MGEGVCVELVKRDRRVLEEVFRWRFCLGRHVHFLCGFSSNRTADRRLKILVDHGLIDRKKILYGVPYLYYLTKDGRRYIHASLRGDAIRVDQIMHDITVLDCIPQLMEKYHFEIEDITTEKELHSIDAFGTRKHRPDFIFQVNDQVYAVEVELTLKSTERLRKNVQDNFLNYDHQIWIVPKGQHKIKRILEECQLEYSALDILILEDLC